MQTAAARLLEKLDFVPTHRVDTFRHLTEHTTISGWSGRITGSKPTVDGMILEVKISSQLGYSGAASDVKTIETYHYIKNGRIEHLDSFAPRSSGITVVN